MQCSSSLELLMLLIWSQSQEIGKFFFFFLSFYIWKYLPQDLERERESFWSERGEEQGRGPRVKALISSSAKNRLWTWLEGADVSSFWAHKHAAFSTRSLYMVGCSRVPHQMTRMDESASVGWLQSSQWIPSATDCKVRAGGQTLADFRIGID